MAGPSEGGGMLEVVGAQRRDVLTAGDVAETERDALGNVSEGAVMWLMWQHLLEQIYERIRPASLNSTGLM